MKIENLFASLRTYKQFLDMKVQQLRLYSGVLSVHSDVALAHYESGSVIEAYVEAELSNGNALTWWLDIVQRGSQWIFEPSILCTEPEGQFTLQHLPERIASDLTQSRCAFLEAFKQAEMLDYYVENSDAACRVQAHQPAMTSSVFAYANEELFGNRHNLTGICGTGVPLVFPIEKPAVLACNASYSWIKQGVSIAGQSQVAPIPNQDRPDICQWNPREQTYVQS